MLSKFKALKTEIYSSANNEYELAVYKSLDGDEIRVNIATDSLGKNILWTLDDLEIPEVIKDESEIVDTCLALAKSAIQENDSSQ